MPKLLLQLTLYALFASGCTLEAGQTDPLTPSELNTHAARYDERTVVVRGYIKLAPEGHILYESQELDAEFCKGVDSGSRDFDVRKYVQYCLTIANPELLYKNQATVNGKTLILRGKFIANYLDGSRIDLGACPSPTAIIIDENDLRQRYPSLLECASRKTITDTRIVGAWRRVSIEGHRNPEPLYVRYYPDGKYASWPWPVDKDGSDSHGVQRGRYSLAENYLIGECERTDAMRIEFHKNRMTLFVDKVKAAFERISPLEPGRK